MLSLAHATLSLLLCSYAPPLFFFFVIPPPPSSPLFPYTTLFRSPCEYQSRAAGGRRRTTARRKSRRLRGSARSLRTPPTRARLRSEEHTSELQSLAYLVCRLLLEKKKKKKNIKTKSEREVIRVH